MALTDVLVAWFAEFRLTLGEALLFIFGILAYALLVGRFQGVISRRVMFESVRVRRAEQEAKAKVAEASEEGATARDVEAARTALAKAKRRRTGSPRWLLYLFAFPLVSFAYVVVLSGALLFMAGGDADPLRLFVIAIAVLGAVRVAAYVSEPTSQDLAKILPLGLLGVFLVRLDLDDLVSSLLGLREMATHGRELAGLFVAVAVLEYGLRFVFVVLRGAKRAGVWRRMAGGAS